MIYSNGISSVASDTNLPVKHYPDEAAVIGALKLVFHTANGDGVSVRDADLRVLTLCYLIRALTRKLPLVFQGNSMKQEVVLNTVTADHACQLQTVLELVLASAASSSAVCYRELPARWIIALPSKWIAAPGSARKSSHDAALLTSTDGVPALTQQLKRLRVVMTHQLRLINVRAPA